MKSPIILIKKRTKKIYIFNCILYCYINEKAVGKLRFFSTAMHIKLLITIACLFQICNFIAYYFSDILSTVSLFFSLTNSA